MVIANVEDHVQDAKLTERYRIYSDLGNEYAPHLGLNQLSLVWAVKTTCSTQSCSIVLFGIRNSANESA